MSEVAHSMPFKQYADAPGVNASLLKIVHSSSMLDAKNYIDNGSPESDSMDFGHCFHSLALEGIEDWATHPATYPAPADHSKVKSKELAAGAPLPWNFSANICKEWRSSLPDDTLILSESETACVRAMSAAAKAELGDYLQGAAEVSMFAEMKGLPMKCRIDLLSSFAPNVIIDFKSCVTANPRKFLISAIDRGYHLQGAINIDIANKCGEKRTEFWLLGIESKPPHATCVIKFKDEPLSLLRVGRAAYRTAFQKLVTAQQSGEWPGYGAHDAEEFAPIWMKDEIERTA